MIKEIKEYYSDGQLQYHFYEKDDEFHGEFKSYHENGRLRRHCFYKDGEIHGEYKFYLKNDSLWQHTIVVNGESLEINPVTLPNEDKLALKLKYNIEFFDD